MQFKACIFYLLFCCFACNHTHDEKPEKADNKTKVDTMDRELKTDSKFDKKKWSLKNGKDYTYRDDMLADLMHDPHLRELKRDAVINLLGQPDRIDSSYLFYRVSEEHIGFFTLHAKTLVIKLSRDSSITWMKIHE